MPPHASHPAFEKRRVLTAFKQSGVVVAFEQQAIACGKGTQHIRCDVAQIGQDAQAQVAIGAGQLQGLAGIVRHGEGVQLQLAQVNGLAISCHVQQAVKVRCSGAPMGAIAHPDRQTFTQGHLANAADMVAVFVGDENSVEVVGAQTRTGQPGI
jgi:hypothetical protein